MTEEEIIKTFQDRGALLEGHFKLRSGLHSDRFFQAALLLQHPDVAARLCERLAERFKEASIETVVSPALGGLIVGHEMGRALGTRAIFAEKKDDDGLVLRRGFSLRKAERVLVAEDVITRGGRVQQTLDLVRGHGAEAVGVAVLVDRSGGAARFDVPCQSLLRLTLNSHQPDQCPLCRDGVPLDAPGSK